LPVADHRRTAVRVVKIVDETSPIILTITRYIMALAPITIRQASLSMPRVVIGSRNNSAHRTPRPEWATPRQRLEGPSYQSSNVGAKFMDTVAKLECSKIMAIN